MTDQDASGELRISVAVPVYRPDPRHLEEAIESVLHQTSPAWELVLVADGSQPAEVDHVLDALDDPRIVVHRRQDQGGIVAASNDAIARATGAFVGFLDNDDTLDRSAVAACIDAIAAHDDTDVVYTDEDKLDGAGVRVVPFHKPSWSPERLRGQMYIGHLAVYRRSLIDELGGLRDEYQGAQDHDLALRATEVARRVTHIPRVLYHWRMSETSTAQDPTAKQWAFEAGVRAVQSHLDRVGLPATAALDPAYVVAVDPALHDHPPVSLIMLTGGRRRIAGGAEMLLVENALRSVVRDSTYPDYEVVVVLDQSTDPALGPRLEEIGGGRVRIVRDPEPFSFSRANNLGVSASSGKYLIFLNDDTQVVTPDWIERFVLWMSQEEVGAVGCCLEYADGRIQHAGIVSRHGGPGHRYAGFHGHEGGAFQSLRLTLNTLAVTGACLGVAREKFEAVGGFTLLFPVNFNDVDLCLKLVSRGWRTVCDNRARLVHFESSSRAAEVESWEHLLLLERWRHLINGDPWDNGNTDGVYEIPPPTALTRLRELADANFPTRSWPLPAPA
jgi:GT2 family glycosyltransferase